MLLCAEGTFKQELIITDKVPDACVTMTVSVPHFT